MSVGFHRYLVRSSGERSICTQLHIRFGVTITPGDAGLIRNISDSLGILQGEFDLPSPASIFSLRFYKDAIVSI